MLRGSVVLDALADLSANDEGHVGSQDPDILAHLLTCIEQIEQEGRAPPVATFDEPHRATRRPCNPSRLTPLRRHLFPLKSPCAAMALLVSGKPPGPAGLTV